MIFTFGGFTVDIDIEKTRQFYKTSQQTLTEGCNCIACQNFVKASDHFSPEICAFFSQLGVDICKAPDMSAMYGEKDRQILHYWGFYHLCGTILPDNDCEERGREYQFAPGCGVKFSDQCALTEQGFPEPIIQMEVNMEVPWILEEQHYLLT